MKSFFFIMVSTNMCLVQRLCILLNTQYNGVGGEKGGGGARFEGEEELQVSSITDQHSLAFQAQHGTFSPQHAPLQPL